MASYIIDNIFYDFSNLTQEQRNKLLKPYHKNGISYVICTCKQQSRVPLIVFLKESSYYLRAYPNNSNREKHHKNCVHYTPTEEDLISCGYSKDAIHQDEEGDYVFSLSVPLNSRTKSVETDKHSYTFTNGSSRSVRNTITLLGLLNFLWEQARLNVYMEDKPIKNIWNRIRKTAYFIRPKGFNNLNYGLSEYLILPKEADEKQWKYNSAKLNQAHEKKKYIMFIVSLSSDDIKSLGLDDATTAEVKFYDYLSVSVKIAKKSASDILASFHNSYGNAINRVLRDSSTKLILIGTAEVKEFKDSKYAEVRSLSAMPVSHERIPFDSSHEKTLTDHLINDGRSFEKPLRYDQASDLKVFPDFILLDTSPKCLLEVYGMDTPEYLERKHEKIAIYESINPDQYLHWDWDVMKSTLKESLVNKPLPSK